jgi:hypothetical protein
VRKQCFATFHSMNSSSVNAIMKETHAHFVWCLDPALRWTSARSRSKRARPYICLFRHSCTWVAYLSKSLRNWTARRRVALVLFWGYTSGWHPLVSSMWSYFCQLP